MNKRLKKVNIFVEVRFYKTFNTFYRKKHASLISLSNVSRLLLLNAILSKFSGNLNKCA